MDGFDFRNRSHSYLRVELSKNPSPKNPIMSERWRGGAAAAAAQPPPPLFDLNRGGGGFSCAYPEPPFLEVFGEREKKTFLFGNSRVARTCPPPFSVLCPCSFLVFCK